LIYTASIMIVLRVLVIGPLTKVWSPVAILAVSSVCGAAGIYFLGSVETAALVLIAATIYGIGQAFFWPCTLGLVSEQFPEGGALTLNSIAGVGMLGVGIIGGPMLGNLQDTQVDSALQANEAIYAEFMDEDTKQSVFGEYRALDQQAVASLNERVSVLEASGGGEDELVVLVEKQAVLDGMTADAKASALRFAAMPAVLMAVSYMVMLMWFKRRGGYKPVDLGAP
jgi:hypothetical protein